jgi:hypothetical protein
MAVKLERRIGIQAPDEVVWEILADVERWPEWNPMYATARGEIRIGDRWSLERTLRGQPVTVINPVILDWAPYDHIHWRHDMMRGWARSIRFFEIEKMGEESIIYSTGEIFDGWLGGSAARRLRNPILEAFEAGNEALKARAEAIWNERRVSGK